MNIYMSQGWYCQITYKLLGYWIVICVFLRLSFGNVFQIHDENTVFCRSVQQEINVSYETSININKNNSPEETELDTNPSLTLARTLTLSSGERSFHHFTSSLVTTPRFLAATRQLYEWYFLSVCLSVRPSHLFDYVPIIASSWNFQELSPWTRVTSM